MADAMPSQPREHLAAERARWFSRGYLGLLGVAYALIVLGALVRAHGAGLACPDWPLCFGEVIPQLDFRVGFEFGHRVLAGLVSLIFLALGVGVLRDPALRAAASRPVLVAAGLLIVQIVLGGLTVLQLLASWTVTAHLVTGNAFALALLWTVLALRDRATGSTAKARAPIPTIVRALVTLSAACLLLQIILGGLVSSRYAGLVCPDWPACHDGVYFPTFDGVIGLQLLHRLNAYGLLASVAATAWSARGVADLTRPTVFALALVLVQVALGVLNVLWRLPVEVTALHSAGAAALVGVLAYCVRTAWLHPLRARDGLGSHEALRVGG